MNVKSRTFSEACETEPSWPLLLSSKLLFGAMVVFPEYQDSRCINVAPADAGIAYTGYSFWSIHWELSPRTQAGSSDGGGILVELV